MENIYAKGACEWDLKIWKLRENGSEVVFNFQPFWWEVFDWGGDKKLQNKLPGKKGPDIKINF